MKIKLTFKGGDGSGNYGHSGRPGKIGGSSDEGGSAPIGWKKLPGSGTMLKKGSKGKIATINQSDGGKWLLHTGKRGQALGKPMEFDSLEEAVRVAERLVK